MIVDEELAPPSKRCSLHPGSPAVATCEGCGRPMCLACAVPVRGVAYGPECLGQVLGEEHEPEPRSARRRAPVLQGVGFGVALATTLLPWTTFGEGSTIFGAWSLSPRWAVAAAVASLLGVVVAVVRARRRGSVRAWDAASVVLGAVVASGAILAWFRPPFPSRPSIVPWIAAGAGVMAAAAAVRSVRHEEG